MSKTIMKRHARGVLVSNRMPAVCVRISFLRLGHGAAIHFPDTVTLSCVQYVYQSCVNVMFQTVPVRPSSTQQWVPPCTAPVVCPCAVTTPPRPRQWFVPTQWCSPPRLHLPVCRHLPTTQTHGPHPCPVISNSQPATIIIIIIIMPDSTRIPSRTATRRLRSTRAMYRWARGGLFTSYFSNGAVSVASQLLWLLNSNQV